jgi:hypothetical protein
MGSYEYALDTLLRADDLDTLAEDRERLYAEALVHAVMALVEELREIAPAIRREV